MYRSMWSDKCVQLYNHHQNQDTEQFQHPSAQFCHSLLLPVPVSFGNHWCTFHFYSFAFSRMSRRWNDTLGCPLSLASFTQHRVFNIRPCCAHQQWVACYCWAVLHCISLSQLGCFQFAALGMKPPGGWLVDHIARNVPNYFPNWLYQFIFPPAMYESFSCSIFLSALDTIFL